MKNEVTSNGVYDLLEYSILKYVLLEGDNIEITPKSAWNSVLRKILEDDEYQKYAISIVQDDFGINSIRCMTTSMVLISNASEVKEEIIDTLLNNLLSSYQDKAKTIPLILTGGFLECSYLKNILSSVEIVIEHKYHNKLTDAVIKSLAFEVDYELVALFLFRKDITLDFKKKLINFLSEEQLSELQGEISITLLKNAFGEDFDPDFDIEVMVAQSKEDSEFNAVMELINDKIYS